MIHTQCDGCFREYKVGDQYAGKTIRCKDCGTWWIIQKGSDGPATVIGRSRPEQDKP